MHTVLRYLCQNSLGLTKGDLTNDDVISRAQIFSENTSR
jgi:hypothetical protein